ncbi:hypothetical protein T03_15430 [Trichinella britovi]|uniref:Uncharacterized protein n=1 Tax=Trichinella britovi TaxID=45882 RepID=A0A0V1CSN0_TRIBR|nr:hypothetical protein T09_9147 [Trichinella sp. T9]KRY52168.1 hypothetical protein T03_15430 [Trichinella britovi]
MSASIGVEKETDAQGRLKRHVDTKLRSIQLNVCHQGKPYWRMQQGKKETNKLELVYRGICLSRPFLSLVVQKENAFATKPCVELLIRAIRLILPWHKHLSDEKEHHQIER